MPNRRRIIIQTLALLLLIAGTLYIARQQRTMPYQHNEGMVFGTFYKITYQYENDLREGIEREMKKVDDALSPFNKNSIISAVNENKPVALNDMFMSVYDLARTVSEDTDGAFDITVAPLVNAWGFGFKHNIAPTKSTIDSIMNFVGYKKVRMMGRTIMKDDPRVMLDCSAIAKGYGSDVVAHYLESMGISNYLVEIGGEIVAKGSNPKGKPWAIGVEKPVDDSLAVKSELQTVLNITDMAMATSGNYRNFYYKGGKKYAHTIDPKTGHPVQHNILSATVIAKRCAMADAYATAFMVVGLDKAKEILGRHKDLKAYIIYDKGGKYGIWHTEGLGD